MTEPKVHYIHNSFAHNELVESYNKAITYEENFPVDEADYIVCGGGDGTLLKTIKEYGHIGIPIWGYNAGTVGFLMNDDFPFEWGPQFKIKTFQMIKVKVSYTQSERDLASIDDHDVKKTKIFQAFNDVMIGGDMNSWIDFDVDEKDDFFGKFKGGGLIFSTPQGSTGINKNNNGVVLPLSSTLWSITGDKTNRPIEYVIKPRRITVNVASRSPVSVWIDGSNDIIRDVERISISKGDTVKVAFGHYDDFKRKRRI